MEPADDLTLPQGPETGRLVFSALLKKRSEWLGEFSKFTGENTALWTEHRATCTRLHSIRRRDPGALFSLLQRPEIATPLRLRHSLSEASIKRWIAAVDRHVSGNSEERPLADQMVFTLNDSNPLAHLEAHPDKEGNRPDLGGRSEEEWRQGLQVGLDLIETHLPNVRDDMRLFVREIVPVGFFEEQHVSASYQEAVGTIYLSLHPNPLTMAEALIHEFSHTKLNAVLELDALLLNEPTELYKSPVRPDPRPIFGVLLAAHAFAAVGELYRRMAGAIAPGETGLGDRLRVVSEGNREAVELLTRHAKPTGVGAALLHELQRLTGVPAN